MPEPEKSEQHLATFGIYSPGSMSPEQLLDEFIARRRQLETALRIVRENERGEPQQHLLVVGPRGMGKTMLLLALAYKLERDPDLGGEWLPVIFPEETYGIGDLADFWLEATGHLLAAIGNEAEVENIEALREENPEDIEEQARDLFLRHLAGAGKRALIVLENIDAFFGAVNDEGQQHRLRAFLMEDDRVMIAASSPSYFDETGKMDLPFYDFFRTIRLERFDRNEMIGMLEELAGVRADGAAVQRVIREEPGRIESLRVLTGGNPRLVKLIYRLLAEGGQGGAKRDLERLLEDCTPYFKHRIEEIRSTEERRAFDHVARHWDPVAVGDVAKALRRPSNKVSIYLGRLVDAGFLEEAPGSSPKRKAYQVAERFYNIYYLMRFSRSARRRLEWLVQAMRVFYSEEDFKAWVRRTLDGWRNSADSVQRSDREAFLYSLTKATEGTPLHAELAMDSVYAAWEHDRLASLGQLLDRKDGEKALGSVFALIESLACLTEEEKVVPNSKSRIANLWLKIGHALSSTHKQYGLAERAIRKAIEIDSESMSAWHILGNLLHDHLGRYEEAKVAYLEAAEFDPDFPYIWRDLGDLLQDHLGQFEKAETAYRRSIKIDSRFSSAWFGLGNLLKDHLGRYDEAEDAYRNEIEIERENAFSWNNLGNLLSSDLERYEEAEEAYRRAIKIHPQDSCPLYNLGNLLHIFFERNCEAEAIYRKAIKLYPADAYPRAGLADLLAELDRLDEAKREAAVGVKSDPSVVWARKVFLDVCGKDAPSWVEILPALLNHRPPANDAVYEMALRGLEFVVTEGALTPAAAAKLIEEGQAGERFADVLLALRAADDRDVLLKASPERRAFAEDFLARIEGRAAKSATKRAS
ncbi:MAG: tetratricopeptide repeat protein [Akkermansiaceae bacterium]|nr:tetratricopeptide repeat protein [Akkermansiaceae bacterium]